MTKYFIVLLILLCLYPLNGAQISVVQFSGNSVVSDKVLLSIIQSRVGTEYSSENVTGDLSLIADYYNRLGLYKTKVYQPIISPTGQNKLSLEFVIENEESIYIDKLDFEGNYYFTDDKLLEKLNPPASISLSELSYINKQIIDLYISRNYLFASSNLHSIEYSGSNSVATFTIEEGKPCRFSNYTFRGNKVTKDKTLIKLSGIDRQPVISPEVLDQASENIRRKEFIKSCDIVPIDENTLLFDVKEDKMTYISGIAGYDNSENVEKNFSGFVNLKFLNLFGTDRNLHFNWESLANDYSELKLYYEDSGPNDFPIGGNITLNRIEQDSTYVDTGVKSQFYYYNLRNRYGIELGFSDITAGSRRPILITPEKQYSAGVLWNYNNVNYYLNPSNGMVLDINFKYTYAKVDSITDHRESTEISWINYEQILPKTVIALGLHGNYLTSHDVDTYNLFTLGGFNSLRGFSENRFKGYFTAWSNLELRYLLSKDSRVHLFFDYGVYQFNDNDTDYSEFNLIGTGFGLRIRTAIGMLGLDYALGYDSKDWTNPMNGMLHFGIETKL